jgi:hypothetical protein
MSPNLISVEEMIKTATDLRTMGLLDSMNRVTSLGQMVLNDLESLFKKVKPKTTTELLGANYLEEIKIYRNKFPVGKKATPQEVLDKFILIFNMNPEITWEKIHQATDLYFEQDIDEMYRMKAGNFIKVDRGGSNIYTLNEYYERIEGGESTGQADEYEYTKVL